MSDYINRQDAIDAIPDTRIDIFENCRNCELLDKEEVIDIIKDLPSAQQERWDTCFSCPLSHGCPVIKGCTNNQAEQYAGEIPTDCPMDKPSAQPEDVILHITGRRKFVSKFDFDEDESEQQWIPCSERLPEVKIGWDSEVNTYLVTVDDGAIYTDIDIIRTSGFNKYGSNVTAWMPLPEPYKGGDTNDVS